MSWVYALAANRGTWSSGLTSVKCVWDETTSPDRPAVRVNVYEQTATSTTIIWTTVSCDTLVTRSYQLQYAPTSRLSGTPCTTASPIDLRPVLPGKCGTCSKTGQVETLFPVVFGNNCFELDSMPVYGTIFQTWLQDHMILCWRSYVRGYASVPVNGPTW